jgi:type III pantothenate kinase
MILLLDVGNTRVKWAWLEELSLAQAGAVAHDAMHTTWYAEIEADGRAPERIVVSNVAGTTFEQAATAWAQARFGLRPEFITASETAFGIRNSYARPAALGVDRWLGMVAAWATVQRPTCILNVGTACTVDALDAHGRHLGGLILPGALLLQESITGLIETTEPAAGLAHAAPLANPLLPSLAQGGPLLGIYLMLAATAERSIVEVERQTRELPRVVLTGGDARLVQPHLRYAAEFIPDLVLAGLAIAATAVPAGARQKG